MATYYVGSGGDNGNNGLSWANRKLTLNGAEDIPVVAGDTVYVGAGTYRETLTIDVAGSSGNPITYIADYTGANTDGIGGVVRITGSNDDITVSRGTCINMGNSRSFRAFRGFLLDSCSGNHLALAASSSNLSVDDCCFMSGSTSSPAISINGTSGNHRVRRCFFMTTGNAMLITHSSTVNDTATEIENCLFLSVGTQIRIDRVGGITVRNSTFIGGANHVRVQTALAAGQVVTVNNCILVNSPTSIVATVAGELVEDYNTFFGNTNNRSNVNTGSNSVTYPPLFDSRWFFQTIYGGSAATSPTQLLLPFDLSAASAFLNLAGTSPTTTDMRGTAVQGAQREWGALEYVSDISFKARQSGMIGGGGGMVIS